VRGMGEDAGWDWLCAAMRAPPRSCFSAAIMEVTWDLERRGAPQKEQGWRPSSAQMILPQLRQFGAGVKSGWMVALQGHLRGGWEGRDGLVESSRAEMADVRSAIEEVVVVFVAGGGWRGLDVPEWKDFFAVLVLTLWRWSDMRLPEADGGSLVFWREGEGSREEAGDGV
jgi:hypothetical protein